MAQLQSHIYKEEKKTGQKVDASAKAKLLQKVQGKTTREVERELLKMSSKQVQAPKEKIVQQSGSECRVHFNLSNETLQNLERVKNTLTKTKELFWDQALNKMAMLAMGSLTPKTKKTVRKEREIRHSRYIPVEVKSKVWERASGACEFISTQTGKVCRSTKRLQWAHVQAFSQGGLPTADNITFQCFAHNALDALTKYPRQFTNALTAPKPEVPISKQLFSPETSCKKT